MSQEAIYNEGLLRLKNLQLNKLRCEYKLDESINNNEFDIDIDINNEVHINKIIDNAIKSINKTYKLDEYEKKYFVKINESGFYMNWHCDDCAIIKHKKDFSPSSNNYKLNDKYSLYINNNLPIYTMIIYLSDYNTDFTGGEFCFIDKTIFPTKNKVIVFDSREIHKVNKINSGIRKNILVKFYKKKIDL